MQYILNQDEYNEFMSLKKQAKEVPDKDKLMELCRLAAEHVPVKPRWAPDKPPAPWQCIYDEEGNSRHHYCDECPAKRVCPAKNKRWSK